MHIERIVQEKRGGSKLLFFWVAIVVHTGTSFKHAITVMIYLLLTGRFLKTVM